MAFFVEGAANGMKRPFAFSALALALVTGFAADASGDTNFAYRIECEVQNQTGWLEPLVWEQGTSPLVELYVTQRERAVELEEGMTARMVIGETPTTNRFAMVSNTVRQDGGNAVLLQWPTIGTNTAATGSWWYNVVFTDTEGNHYWSGSGSLDIQPTLSNGEDGLVWQYYADSTERVTYITTNHFITTNQIVYTNNPVTSVNGQTGDVTVEMPDLGPYATREWVGEQGYLTEHQSLDGYATTGDLATVRATADAALPAAWTNDAQELNVTGGMTLGGIRRTGWPSFETGGPLFPDFVQAADMATNWTRQYLPLAERLAGGTKACLVALENVPVVGPGPAWNAETSWTNVKSTTEGAVPRFVDTDTLAWHVGDPMPINTATATGFWWKVSGPATGTWAVAIGSYTGAAEIVKTGSLAETNRYWTWGADVPGTLRAKANDDLFALATTSGKSMAPFADYEALKTTNAVRNPNFWAAPMDLTCVSPWNVKTQGTQSGYNGNSQHTAITRRHIVGANHWHLNPSNGVVHFYDNDNHVYVRTIVKGKQLRSTDCWVGMLDEDLPESIQPARIVHSNDWGKLFAQPWLPEEPFFPSRLGPVRGSGIEALHFRPHSCRSVWCMTDGRLADDETVAYTNNMTLRKTDSWHKDGAFVGGESSSPILLWVDGQTCIAETVRRNDGSGVNITKMAPEIEAQIRAWGGTAETNLYWADLSNWPAGPAETESEEE